MSAPAAGLAVIGIGNPLRGDDGVGPAAVHAMARDWMLPEGTRLLDGGALGVCALSHILDARHVLVIDAIACDAPPGTVVRIDGERAPALLARRLSSHESTLEAMLAAAACAGRGPEKIIVLGVVPERLHPGIGLSREVEEALPRLVEAVVAEAAAMGHRLVRSSPQAERSAAGRS